MRKYFANYNLKISLKNIFLLLAVCGIGIANTAYAHEAYVLPQNYFWQVTDSISQPTGLTPLTNPQNFNTGVTIAVFVLLALCVNFFLRRTKFFQKIGKKIEQYSDIGPVLVRIAIAVSFFRAATVHSLFGPELPFSNIIHADLVSPLLIVSALFILFGFLTEIGALLGLIAFTFAFASHGLYMLTYCMYVGELLVLLLFGVSRYSLDAIFFPNLVTRFKKLEPYATTLIRFTFGVALIYTAIQVKLFHPELTIRVIQEYNLTQFRYLFPSDPALITLGAGIVEIVIGLFIIFGFELRLTLVVMLFYLTLSISYFGESVWPHYILYGTALALFFEKEIFSLDHIVLSHHRKKYSWWRRPFLPHRHKAEQSS
ncbi:MAG: DoxX family protein [Candidatus Pacebacteria bacterium]|nr:DoxX family protein [Candidatus Paceibacterota bacterium]